MRDDSRPVCFVVMGFGKKTDFESGRTLDLDATYNAIISPAAVAAGLRCIRSDEIVHSGVIDVAMYEMLLRAEMVIADISTGNVNAVYELGVRHALRPRATIVMKENVGKLYLIWITPIPSNMSTWARTLVIVRRSGPKGPCGN